MYVRSDERDQKSSAFGFYDNESQPWKHKARGCVGLLAWLVSTMSDELMVKQWPQLLPMVLTVIDDYDCYYKALGVELARNMVVKMGRSARESGTVFKSIIYRSDPGGNELLVNTFGSLFAILDVAYPKEVAGLEHTEGLWRILAEGVIRGLVHSGEKVKVQTILVGQVPVAVGRLGIASVRYLKPLVGELVQLLEADLFGSADMVTLHL
ncbi:hypothetical protein EV182_004346, partial [Spiromyces aspiralis]